MRVKKLDHPARVKILETSLDMFLHYGYTGTTYKMITTALGCKPASLTNFFGGKEYLLLELLGRTAPLHFAFAARTVGADASAPLQYCMTVAIQFFMCAQNRTLQDVYLAAYSIPLTRAAIVKNAAAMTRDYFSSRLPDWTQEDFYAAELSNTGIEYVYMAEECAEEAALRALVRRALAHHLKIYEFSRAEQTAVLDGVFAYDLPALARGMAAEIATGVQESLTQSVLQ